MIINQPYDGQLGIYLMKEMSSGKYNQLTIMVAYAKLSGVFRLLPYLKDFKNNAGKIRCIVGIDQQNTTYEAIEQIANIADEFYIFHSEGITQTFHVKCYWLSNETSCSYAIGSNNLTAGGLFSNYEMSETVTLEGSSAHNANNSLEEIYQNYINNGSFCSSPVDQSLIDQLLKNKYIVHEIEQRKTLAEANKKLQKRDQSKSGTVLFGKEYFPAPTLPAEYQKNKGNKNSPDAKPSAHSSMKSELEPFYNEENIYLIRHVPKAGNRSKQVHFTLDLLSNYFCLDIGENIIMQEMLPSGEVGPLEERKIVFSKKNHNVKIELTGASILDDHYPDDHNKRPILIIKKVNVNLFVYMLILEGNDGYDAINERLKKLPPMRSLPYEVIDEVTMFELWNDCPIV